MMKSVILVIVVALFIFSCDKNVGSAGCSGLGDSTVVTIRYGEKKYPCNSSSACFGFTKLIDDSRCPEGAACVWRGSASIEMETCGGKEGSLALEIYHPVEQLIDGNKYSIELTALNPYPSTSHPHDVSEYVATITIKKK